MDGFSRAAGALWVRAVLVVLGLAVLVAGSRVLTSRMAPAVAVPVGVEQLKSEGDLRLASGDVAGALQTYDKALTLAGDDATVYYRVGAALSHLGDREQTIAHFLWVVRHGRPDLAEVRLAREWLERERALPADVREALGEER